MKNLVMPICIALLIWTAWAAVGLEESQKYITHLTIVLSKLQSTMCQTQLAEEIRAAQGGILPSACSMNFLAYQSY